jgi:hypothetical protein
VITSDRVAYNTIAQSSMRIASNWINGSDTKSQFFEVIYYATMEKRSCYEQLSEVITHAEMKNKLTSLPPPLSDICCFRVVMVYNNYG